MIQLVSDYSEVKMDRKVGGDGMATEEYNFNSEVAIEHQVHSFLVILYLHIFCTALSTYSIS